jgi:hypothetical protein
MSTVRDRSGLTPDACMRARTCYITRAGLLCYRAGPVMLLLYTMFMLAEAADPIENVFDDCMDFHCVATPARIAEAPLLFVGALDEVDLAPGLSGLAARTWRLTVTGTLRGGVGSGVLDVTGPGVDGQCTAGDEVLVAARSIMVAPCGPEEGPECSAPVLGDLAELDFSGSMVCRRADGSLGSPGAQLGPICLNGADFRHDRVFASGEQCPADYQASFEELVEVVRSQIDAATTTPVALPGVPFQPTDSEPLQ